MNTRARLKFKVWINNHVHDRVALLPLLDRSLFRSRNLWLRLQPSGRVHLVGSKWFFRVVAAVSVGAPPLTRASAVLAVLVVQQAVLALEDVSVSLVSLWNSRKALSRLVGPTGSPGTGGGFTNVGSGYPFPAQGQIVADYIVESSTGGISSSGGSSSGGAFQQDGGGGAFVEQ